MKCLSPTTCFRYVSMHWVQDTAENLTYIMQVSLSESLGIGVLYTCFSQEDLDAGCAFLGVQILLFFFMISNLKNNIGSEGTCIESRLGERKEGWIRGSEGNLMGQYLHFYIWLILICGLWVDIPGKKVGWYVLLWKHCYNQKGESDSPNLESFAFFIWAKASGKCECHLRPPSRWTCKEHCSLSHSEKGGAETGSFVVYGHFDRL